MKIAIDTAVILCQANRVIRRRYRRYRRKTGRYVQSTSLLFYRAIHFLERGIEPIFVLEGQRVPHGDKDERYSDGRMGASDRLLTLMGLPAIHACGEGEATGAYVVRCGDAEAFATPNIGDAFFFECPLCIKSTLHADVQENLHITLSAWLESLGFHTIDQYRDYFILIGSDYNDKLLPRGMGKKTAQRLIQKHGRIEGIPDMDFDLNVIDALRDLGRHPAVTTNYSITFKQPRYDELRKFLTTECGFSKNRVNAGISRVQSQMLRNRSYRRG